MPELFILIICIVSLTVYLFSISWQIKAFKIYICNFKNAKKNMLGKQRIISFDNDIHINLYDKEYNLKIKRQSIFSLIGIILSNSIYFSAILFLLLS